MDGSASALLLGQNNGSYLAMPYQRNGLVVPGDAKSVSLCDMNRDGWPDLVVGVNNAPALAFEHQLVPGRRISTVRLRGRPGNPTAIGARVTVRTSGRLQHTAEVQAGGGYLAQQTAALYFGLRVDEHVTKVSVRWPNGLTTEYLPKQEELTIVIDEPPERTRFGAQP
jgi:hypothetical protein